MPAEMAWRASSPESTAFAAACTCLALRVVFCSSAAIVFEVEISRVTMSTMIAFTTYMASLLTDLSECTDLLTRSRYDAYSGLPPDFFFFVDFLIPVSIVAAMGVVGSWSGAGWIGALCFVPGACERACLGLAARRRSPCGPTETCKRRKVTCTLNQDPIGFDETEAR